jgi:2-polyprenyl-3-methyl-5-hydroxy-6-metoxy-1,4-benzoquinol methylase
MAIDSKTRLEPKATLQAMDVHDSWTRHFRSGENDGFYTLAFDYIGRIFGDPGHDAIVDAGCGSATKSLLLARRGYRVRGLDFSEAILTEARSAAVAAGLSDRMEFQQADLTALTLPSGSTRRVLCWGVLMHVPAIDKAVGELARIIAPGGCLVISEGNTRSVQAWSLRALKALLGKERAQVNHTPAGIEFWEETRTGKLMTRQADIPWLIKEFAHHGLRLRERHSGQFTEIYTLVPWKPLRTLVHVFNNAWFRVLGSVAGPSFANILVFERPVGDSGRTT